MDKIQAYKLKVKRFFIGHLREFQSNPLQFMMEMASKKRDFASFRLGPFLKVHLVSNPDLIKEILVTKQQNFIKSRDIQALKSVVGEGLLTSEKDFHMRQRRLIQPAFKKTQINQYAQDMIDVTNEYINRWKDHEERLLSKDIMDITLGIISKTMFSLDFKEGSDLIGEPLEKIMKLAIKQMRSVVTLPLWLPTKNNREYKKAVKELDEVLYTIISKRREVGESKEDLLGILMAAKDEADGKGMSDKQLRDEMMTIFLAGHETTANALLWTIFLLSQNPEVEEKLRLEINEVLGKTPLSPEHFMKLAYVQNTIWESFRLFPPAYVIGRQVDNYIEIGGKLLKKGEMVLISQYVMHRSPDYFKDPNSFVPERFENQFIKTIPPYAYFPFGGGPRVCIGNHFAFMECVLVLTCIMNRFDIQLVSDPLSVKPQPLITLRPKNGLRAIVKKR